MSTETKTSVEVVPFEILIVGDRSVGKTSVMRYICDECSIGQFRRRLNSQTYITFDKDTELTYKVWDMGHSTRDELEQQYNLKQFHAIILVFDLNNVDTYYTLFNWFNFIVKHANILCKTVVFANKFDLRQRHHKLGLVEQACKEYQINLYRTSTRTGCNIIGAVNTLLFDIVQCHLRLDLTRITFCTEATKLENTAKHRILASDSSDSSQNTTFLKRIFSRSKPNKPKKMCVLKGEQ